MQIFYQLVLSIGLLLLLSQTISSSPHLETGEPHSKKQNQEIISKFTDSEESLQHNSISISDAYISNSDLKFATPRSGRICFLEKSKDRESISDNIQQEVDRLFAQVMSLPRSFELMDEDNENIWETLHVCLEHPDCRMSRFKVGTIIIIDGKAYPGVNNEDPSFCVCCGERSAMWGAQPRVGKTGEETKITISYVFAIDPNSGNVETGISSSCGLCRQAYVVHGNPEVVFIFNNELMKMRATELLPDPYLFLPVQPMTSNKAFISPEKYVEDILNLPQNEEIIISAEVRELFHEAIVAALVATAPYHKVREGAALRVQSHQFKRGYKIFEKGIYQNASYGVTSNPISAVYHDAQHQLNKRNMHNAINESPIYEMVAIFGLNESGELVHGVTPSGEARQAAAEVDGCAYTLFYYINRQGELVCAPLSILLPLPFTFKSIVGSPSTK